jgi:hypothetical protein
VGQGISEVLPFAVGVAISPVPIVGVILVLFSSRARSDGPAFLVGWIVGLSVLATVVYALANGADASTDSSASDSVSWLRVGLGVLLLALAVRNWRKQPAPGAEPELPKWMQGLDSMTPLRTLGLGVLLSGLNPKNLVLTIGAAAGLGQLDISTGDAVVSLVVFVVVGSLSIAGPVVYALAAGDRARHHLDDLKAWLTLHNSAVMAVLFLVFGVLLIAKGLGLLTA